METTAHTKETTKRGVLLFVLFSGVIRTALGPKDMDRETKEHYQVVIEAKDMAGQRGGLTGTTVVNISLTDVNDNPPVFTQSKKSSPTATKKCILELRSKHLKSIRLKYKIDMIKKSRNDLKFQLQI